MTQNTQNTKNTEKTAEKPSVKDFTMTLSFSSLMTAFTALVGCVVVAFMMGVIVGRDDVSRPSLANIVAEKELAKTQEGAAQGDTAQDSSDATQTELAPLEPARAHKAIMSPEELKYATALKGKSEQETQKTSPDTSANTSPAQNTGNAQDIAQNTAPSVTQGEAAQKPEKPAPTVNSLYDYIYQVASLKNEDSVDTLRAQLEGEGMRTRMVKSGDYLMVQVLMRGTEAQGQALQERMIELKLGKPVQQQKKLVE